jgi:hypothetical protein
MDTELLHAAVGTGEGGFAVRNMLRWAQTEEAALLHAAVDVQAKVAELLHAAWWAQAKDAALLSAAVGVLAKEASLLHASVGAGEGCCAATPVLRGWCWRRRLRCCMLRWGQAKEAALLHATVA